MRKLFFQFIIINLVFCLCLVNAAGVLAFTIGDERELGEKLLYSVRSSFDLIDDPDISQYINDLGQSILDVAGVQYFDYHFFVINNKEFNAFAAPSGLIFLHSGLIGTMQSEDELVSVIAHEIGHIVKRHLASRVEKGKYTSLATLGMAVAAVAFGGTVAPVLLTGALATGQSINLHYSRIDEEEADLLAFEWMEKMGRNPRGQVKMLEAMRRIARYRSDKLPQYLLTHPNPEARLEYIQSLVDIEKGQHIQHHFMKGNDFAFMRFKYRILSQVKDATRLKAALASILADKKTSEFSRIMADYGLSQISRKENDYRHALEYLQKVIQFFPDKTILLTDRGMIEFDEGRLQAAKHTFENVLQKNNLDMYATFALAKIYYRLGMTEQARNYLQRVVVEMPEYSDAYFQLGKIAADENHDGLSSYYLGKFYLYEGKLKFAKMSFRSALNSKDLSPKIREESTKLLKKIKQLRK
ncbi:beta-barrel assembly-enhancing protease [Desulfomarina profundi]|uniref:Beta-barrel assembly-enhancing protease n=1 Tax=Desulfomarina profundi TaxID=2772557 RepID=A0A8D5FVW2_9BACT|nr:M48 family metallopeptidase [Desulfomarina profundi]BCL60872.1 beta-barrel assembly-enhancing protease [Desulfomarina profundi]